MASSGLASLTATYTDSEGEDEPGDLSSPSPEKIKAVLPATAAKTPAGSPAIPQQNAKRLARLVSYHDDTVVSDEEGVGGPESIVGMEADEAEEESTNDETVASELLEISLDGVKLPPEPLGHCSMALQDKIKRLDDRVRTVVGFDMNKVIQERKDFRNPSIYEKLIQFCGINELGTNYPPHIYDPLRWGKESFYEELSKVQKSEMDRREKERKEKTKVEFVSGTAKRSGGGSLGSAEEEAKKRKSKWDQVGGTVSGSVIAPSIIRPVSLMQQPSLTASATGTKGTVISAFGSLPKKPKN